MARVPLDAYYTPDEVATACVATLEPYRDAIAPRGLLIEPSVGGGAFARALRAGFPGNPLMGVDVNPDAAGLALVDHPRVADFARWSPDVDHVGARWVVGNPPYGDALAHICNALEVVRRNGGGVAMLLRLAFLESEARAEFWDANPLAALHVLTHRPSFTGGKTDSCAYGWFVWRDGHRGPTILGEPIRWRCPGSR